MTVTNFAVFIAQPTSLLSPFAATAFGVVCVMALALAVLGESRRDRADRKDALEKIPHIAVDNGPAELVKTDAERDRAATVQL